jgi:Protein of unknown function with PCYCGC motif
MRRVALGLVMGMATIGAFAQWSNPADDVPAYNAQPPSAKLPPILAGSQLKGPSFRYPWQVQVYQMAVKIPAVLHQLPCYCRCDRALGHNSLHSCFENTHGAECSTCAKEAVYAYRLTKQGKTPKQIREGIEHKEYESIDLDKLGS